MHINFYPEFDDLILELAVKEYQNIWNLEGEKFKNIIEKLCNLKFQEKVINCIVFEGVSQSSPLILRASYDINLKKTFLIHELTHRILSSAGYEVSSTDKYTRSFESHKLLNLVLYDIWIQLFGKEIAEDAVKYEKGLSEIYNQAWDWALSFPEEVRSKKFNQNILKNISTNQK